MLLILLSAAPPPQTMVTISLLGSGHSMAGSASFVVPPGDYTAQISVGSASPTLSTSFTVS